MRKPLLWAALLLSCAAWADVPTSPLSNAPPDALLDARVEAVSRELRCVVCQNQSVADSNAPLAQDLKQRVRSLLAAGQTEAQVRDHLVARYGDQVLYRPPLRPDTALLWTAPVLLTAFGIGLLAWQRRRASPLDPAELEPDSEEPTPTP